MKKNIFLLPILLVTLATCALYDDVEFTVPEEMSVEVGGSKQIEVTIISGDVDTDEISYYSDDNSSVTVNENGIVQGIVLGGTATITVIIRNTDKEIEVNVVDAEQVVTGIDVPSTVAVILGSTASVRAFVSPDTALNKSINYVSDNEAIATVDSSTGIIRGVSEGQTKITSTTVDGGYTGITTVYVTTYSAPVTAIVVPSYLGVRNGGIAQITYETIPADAPSPAITYTSSNEAIATVDASGKVTGRSVGSTIVTLTSVGVPSVEIPIDVY